MAKKIKLSKKAEKQYNKLSKRFNITRREFKDFYTNVRKANAKGRRLKKTASALYAPKFSLNVNSLITRHDFTRTRKSVNKVLRPEYRLVINAELRERCYSNIRKMFGVKASQYVIEQLKKMTDAELKEFFRQNQDIEQILWDSDQRLIKWLGITIEKIESRLEETNVKRHPVKLKHKKVNKIKVAVGRKIATR